MKLTTERLREVLSYDALTGVFLWIKPSVNSPAAVGDVAGCPNVDGYIVIWIDGTLYYAHRLAWLYVHGVWPTKMIDHKNEVKSDNWLLNLRDVSNQANVHNQCGLPAHNTSGVKGVSWHKQSGKWRAQIRVDGRVRFLGLFKEISQATNAYSAGKLRYHIPRETA